MLKRTWQLLLYEVGQQQCDTHVYSYLIQTFLRLVPGFRVWGLINAKVFRVLVCEQRQVTGSRS